MPLARIDISKDVSHAAIEAGMRRVQSFPPIVSKHSKVLILGSTASSESQSATPTD